MKPSILITQRIPSTVLDRLEHACEVDLNSSESVLTPDELKTRVHSKQGLLCMVTDKIDQDIINAGNNLKVISNIAVGFDNIAVQYAQARQIVVTNTPNVLTESVAEFTWGLILSVTRRIVEGDRLIRSNGWEGWALDFLLGMELRGRQLGIVGAGKIGQAVAARAKAFGMRSVYSFRHDETGSKTKNKGIDRMPLDQLLQTSDVVSLHLPLSSKTRHLIDRRALTRMKRSAYLINTSRGPVVDEAALVWALQERLIAGAALDVYEREPVVHPELMKFENVVLSPHLGSATKDTRMEMVGLAAKNLLAVLAGQPPLTPIP